MVRTECCPRKVESDTFIRGATSRITQLETQLRVGCIHVASAQMLDKLELCSVLNAGTQLTVGRLCFGCRLFLAGQTCARAGFEEPTLFATEEDGLLHFIGHNHGHCAEKYVSHAIGSEPLLAGCRATALSG